MKDLILTEEEKAYIIARREREKKKLEKTAEYREKLIADTLLEFPTLSELCSEFKIPITHVRKSKISREENCLVYVKNNLSHRAYFDIYSRCPDSSLIFTKKFVTVYDFKSNKLFGFPLFYDLKIICVDNRVISIRFSRMFIFEFECENNNTRYRLLSSMYSTIFDFKKIKDKLLQDIADLMRRCECDLDGFRSRYAQTLSYSRYFKKHFGFLMEGGKEENA